MTAVLLVVAAAVGALVRHLTAHLLAAPAALLVVNTVGAGILGGLVAADVSTATVTVVGVAFCGSLTTFSSALLEAWTRGARRGAGYALATTAAAWAAAVIGMSVVG